MTQASFRRVLPIGLIIAASIPIFFEAYRIFLFGTIPIDDYREYVLLLIGRPEGVLPSSPFAYRIGSVAAALPFYVLPPIRLSLAPEVPEPMLRAAVALSALTWISTALTALLFYVWAARAGRAW